MSKQHINNLRLVGRNLGEQAGSGIGCVAAVEEHIPQSERDLHFDDMVIEVKQFFVEAWTMLLSLLLYMAQEAPDLQAEGGGQAGFG